MSVEPNIQRIFRSFMSLMQLQKKKKKHFYSRILIKTIKHQSASGVRGQQTDLSAASTLKLSAVSVSHVTLVALIVFVRPECLSLAYSTVSTHGTMFRAVFRLSATGARSLARSRPCYSGTTARFTPALKSEGLLL